MDVLQLMSFDALARRLADDAVGLYGRLQYVLEVAASQIMETARDEFGVYQKGIDEFVAWAPLAESTKAERTRLGYTPDDPLLRSGALQASVVYEVHGLDAVIGTPSQIGFWHEFGTSRMPPRPVFGPALARNMGFLGSVLGDAIMARDTHFNFGMLDGGRARLGAGEDAQRETRLTL